MTVRNELIDRVLADYKKHEDLIGEDGLLKQLASLRAGPSMDNLAAIVRATRDRLEVQFEARAVAVQGTMLWASCSH